MHSRRHSRGDRRGAVVVLVLFFLVVLVGCVSLALDLGYLAVARTELQRSADSAALAAAWELIDEEMLTGDYTMAASMEEARGQATTYAAANRVCTGAPGLETNADNGPNRDVVVGTIWNLSDQSEAMSYESPFYYNVVQVRVRRTPEMNGQVPMFFAQIWGKTGYSGQAVATAGVLKNVGGFRAPPDGENLNMLPFALKLESWKAVLAKQTVDEWAWDPETKTITAGQDGIHETNLFPQGTNSAGNAGTIDIGGDDNSADHIAEQITDGVTAEDLAYHGGSLELDANGELLLNGDTGISAGVKDELLSIMGKPVIIPIFSKVESPGNNAQFTIVMFVGVRILEVDFSGNSNSNKRLMIQPANVITQGVIAGLPKPGATPEESSSYFVYSYPVIVR